MEKEDPARRGYELFSTDQMAWVDGFDELGNRVRLIGRCLDVSQGGLSVTLPRAVVVGSLVRLGVPTKGVQLDCEVRHCTRLGDRFKVGLKFKCADDPKGQTTRQEREYSRFVVNRIAWVECDGPSGESYRIAGRCLDVSGGGICVRIPQPLEIGSDVRVGVPGEHMKALAEVRNCTETKGQFKVGLCFRKD